MYYIHVYALGRDIIVQTPSTRKVWYVPFSNISSVYDASRLPLANILRRSQGHPATAFRASLGSLKGLV